MSRGVLGAGLGAAGATVYLRPDILQDYVKELVWGPRPGPAVAPMGKELEHLQRLVEDLSRQVAAGRHGPAPVTVVHAGAPGERAGAYVLYGVTGAVLGVVVYLRVLRGWSFGDMLYATRRGLREGLAQVSAGLDQLGGRLAEVKAKLQERIAALAARQEDMLGAQAEMRAALAGVGRDVEHTRGQVGQVHAVVMDLEASMAEVGVNQRHANHGIFVLCKAVSELMAGSDIPSKAQLIEYTQQHPVWVAAAAEQRLQGLESLLSGGASAPRHAASPSLARPRDGTSSPERSHSPFLLPPGGAAPAAGGPLPGSGSGVYGPPLPPSAQPRKAYAEAVAGMGMGASPLGPSSSSVSGSGGQLGQHGLPAPAGRAYGVPPSVVHLPTSVSVGGESAYRPSEWS